MGDMSIRGSPNEYVPNNETGPSNKSSGKSIKESALSSIRKTPTVSISSPRRTTTELKTSFSQQAIPCLIQKVLERRAGSMVAKQVSQACGKLEKIALAESIALEVKMLPKSSQEVFWKNIAAYTIELKRSNNERR